MNTDALKCMPDQQRWSIKIATDADRILDPDANAGTSKVIVITLETQGLLLWFHGRMYSWFGGWFLRNFQPCNVHQIFFPSPHLLNCRELFLQIAFMYCYSGTQEQTDRPAEDVGNPALGMKQLECSSRELIGLDG